MSGQTCSEKRKVLLFQRRPNRKTRKAKILGKSGSEEESHCTVRFGEITRKSVFLAGTSTHQSMTKLRPDCLWHGVVTWDQEAKNSVVENQFALLDKFHRVPSHLNVCLTLQDKTSWHNAGSGDVCTDCTPLTKCIACRRLVLVMLFLIETNGSISCRKTDDVTCTQLHIEC